MGIESTVINKVLITGEDINVGVGKVKQIRNGKEYELKKVNSALLQGPLVLDILSDLDNLTFDDVPSGIVIMKYTGDLYYFTGSEWVKKDYNEVEVEQNG